MTETIETGRRGKDSTEGDFPEDGALRYPSGDPKGKALFDALEKRVEEGRYDDEFLLMLIDYQRRYPDSEHFDIFYAKYAVFHGNHRVALEHAQRAYGKRKVNLEVWKLLVLCYQALGQPERAVPFQGYCCKFYTNRLDLTMSSEELRRCLRELTVAMGRGNYAPFCESRMLLSEGMLTESQGIFGGEYLPFSDDGSGYAYWVGVYNELSRRSGAGSLLQNAMETGHAFDLADTGFTFDIRRSRTMQEMDVKPGDSPLALPIAACGRNQCARFKNDEVDDDSVLGQWEYSFFRIDRDTHVSSSSDEPLVFGKPIPLVHRAGRRKIALNILLDALCWNAVRQQAVSAMPRSMEFFSRGILFDQHFSVAEYTYPALPAIETGMYPHHSQIFNERAAIQLDEGHATLSERMAELGYYCVNIMGGGDAVYNGTTRGYDRLLVNAYDLSSSAGVERVIRQMEAFSECDQFIFLHIMETHPWPVDKFPVGTETQVKLSLRDIMDRERQDKTSVYLPCTPVYQDSNRRAIRRVDRNLGMLYDYLLSHYDEDEYLVQLYSDHGTPIYDEHPGIVSDGQTRAAWMLRGSGVPAKGIREELTSAVDIYPAMAKLVGFPVGDRVDGNLPAALGGKERECVFSNSMFPGQTYKLCVRTKLHECCLESRGPVDEDGTVDLSGARMEVRLRESGTPVRDPVLERYFIGQVKDYTQSFNHEGRHWRSMREARPEWFRREAAENGF